MSNKRGRRSAGGTVRRQSAPGGPASAPARGARPRGTAGALPAPRLARPGSGQPARELDATAALEALAQPGASALELAGAGALQRALADFAREQDRQANRAWRRPGGLARMGWL
ncbi:MAG TPA: hypothetical protein VGR57_21630 [Ktedonobacterales bacterium]|nr:hypothetical protein [Ktedonobacterales bacterium]